MTKIKYIFPAISLFFIFMNSIYAQSNKITGLETYKTKRDSLLQQKGILSVIRNNIKDQIDSLKTVSFNLDDKISSALEEIKMLYAKKFGNDKANRIMNKQVWKGMTEKMLQASWGKPDKIDKNVEKWGVFTQWYFGDVTFFFKDGKLTDWEEK